MIQQDPHDLFISNPTTTPSHRLGPVGRAQDRVSECPVENLTIGFNFLNNKIFSLYTYSTPSLHLPICVSGTPRAVITFRNSGLLHRLHLLLNIVANVNERTTFKREEVVII